MLQFNPWYWQSEQEWAGNNCAASESNNNKNTEVKAFWPGIINTAWVSDNRWSIAPPPTPLHPPPPPPITLIAVVWDNVGWWWSDGVHKEKTTALRNETNCTKPTTFPFTGPFPDITYPPLLPPPPLFLPVLTFKTAAFANCTVLNTQKDKERSF